MMWNTSFMWDGGITHLEVMPFAPITHPKEMADDIPSILMKLKNHTHYPLLFEESFPNEGLTERNFFYALTNCMLALISDKSKYDNWVMRKKHYRMME
jgi:Cytochrome c peroxidase